MSESTNTVQRTYAHVINSVVVETIVTDYDVTKLFPSKMTWVDITTQSPMPARLWAYVGGAFSPPAAVVPASPKLTSLEFMALLTPAEQAAIAGAGLANASVMLWLIKLSGAMYIDLGDPQTVGGVHALAAAGLLTSDRVTAILANQAPVAAASSTATANTTGTASALNATYTATAS